jgi:integrase
MRYSGLQISDAIARHPNQLADGRLRLYTTKTGEAVYVPLPPCVIAALKKIERRERRYFSTGHAKPSVARSNWSRYLVSLFRLATIDNGHSQRFRDTFSTSLLEQGVRSTQSRCCWGTRPSL